MLGIDAWELQVNTRSKHTDDEIQKFKLEGEALLSLVWEGELDNKHDSQADYLWRHNWIQVVKARNCDLGNVNA